MKAAILTIDALFAFFLASATFVVVAQTLNYQSPNLERQNIFNAANDLLAVMQNDGTLASYASQPAAQIQSDLAGKISLLPQNYCGNLTVSIYSARSGAFSIEKTATAVSNCGASMQSAKAKRAFYSSSMQLYGIVEMEVWLK